MYIDIYKEKEKINNISLKSKEDFEEEEKEELKIKNELEMFFLCKISNNYTKLYEYMHLKYKKEIDYINTLKLKKETDRKMLEIEAKQKKMRSNKYYKLLFIVSNITDLETHLLLTKSYNQLVENYDNFYTLALIINIISSNNKNEYESLNNNKKKLEEELNKIMSKEEIKDLCVKKILELIKTVND